MCFHQASISPERYICIRLRSGGPASSAISSPRSGRTNHSHAKVSACDGGVSLGHHSTKPSFTPKMFANRQSTDDRRSSIRENSTTSDDATSLGGLLSNKRSSDMCVTRPNAQAQRSAAGMSRGESSLSFRPHPSMLSEATAAGALQLVVRCPSCRYSAGAKVICRNATCQAPALWVRTS